MEGNVNSITAFSASTVAATERPELKQSEQLKGTNEPTSRSEKIELARKSLQEENKVAKQQAEERVEKDQDRASVEDVVKSINQILEVHNRDVKFVVDERDGQFFTSVLNRSTDELIREIPSEEYRQLSERLRKFQDAIGETTGLFVDKLV
ncbi:MULTISPECIES: flagellar protein FlaG [unclassified Agarivorans]|uniref:flagellar protein FlaG n=1 Tax=unclassified Agarivorans TaxID=2636026 RepID=UPI003D7E3CB8